jgi:bacillithiol system protein YtxJ
VKADSSDTPHLFYYKSCDVLPNLFVARLAKKICQSIIRRKLAKVTPRLQYCCLHISEGSVSHNLNQLHSLQALQEAIEESKDHPVLIFKHSNSCPISGRALHQFHTYLENADPNLSYHLITVQTDRPVSNEVEERLGVLHETPQVIIVRDGRQIWNASHNKITTMALESAVHMANQ